MEFNKKLKNAREQKGMTQAELGQIAGVAQATICDIETGAKKPKLETAVKLCRALNVKLEDMVEG